MKMNKTMRYLSLLFGKNKGFVLVVDALLAVVIAVIAIAASTIFIGMSSGEPMADLQMSRTGYDILSIIGYKGLWSIAPEVEAELVSLLPSNYAMIINEQCDIIWGNMAKANTLSYNLPEKKDIITGERVIVKVEFPVPGNLEYCRVRFFIWLK